MKDIVNNSIRYWEPRRVAYNAVLALVVAGMNNREIASKLFLSQGTVRLHVSNVLRKLEAPNRTAAAMLAVQNGLVDQPKN